MKPTNFPSRFWDLSHPSANSRFVMEPICIYQRDSLSSSSGDMHRRWEECRLVVRSPAGARARVIMHGFLENKAVEYANPDACTARLACTFRNVYTSVFPRMCACPLVFITIPRIYTRVGRARMYFFSRIYYDQIIIIIIIAANSVIYGYGSAV